MAPLLPIVAGFLALAAGIAILRSYGSRFRVARLLATTPRVTVREALEIAASGVTRFVRVDGRIDSDDQFEDAAHQPLVFRRTRFEARHKRRWATFEDSREAVPFAINEGLDTIAVDEEALGDGLVVVIRESTGVAGDVPDRAPATLPARTPVRAIIEQVSSVEHAIALGVPTVSADGTVRLTAGMGRPLVLTTLEIPEAMRVLAVGGRLRPWLAAACLVAGLALLLIGIAWAGLGAIVAAAATAGRIGPAVALAADPTPSRGPGSDTRSVGEGPGLVGDPAMAILLVAGIALAAIVATTIYVRLSGGPGTSGDREESRRRP